MSPLSPVVQQAATFLVNYINDVYLRNFSGKCARLELARVIRAERFSLNKKKYSIIFETGPSSATFDATVSLLDENTDFFLSRLFRSAEVKFNVIGDIVRVSKYGLTSKCVDSYFVKNFCYCLF
jgi:hypothetical protein